MLNPGTRLGPYEIGTVIGAGGMGEVYRARDPRLGRDVATKVLPATLASDPQFRERFEREARAVAALNHANICTVHDVGQHDGTDYLVMELLEGETLATRLERARGSEGPGLGIGESLRIGIQIAEALDVAHRAGIVHRDLKPGNIMLTKSGAKLLDFGLAKAGAQVATGIGLSMLPTTPPGLTAQGTILGTFQYMAPEQLEGQEADARTDIFAFGATLYEMLTGRKAFAGKSHASLIGSILKDTPAPLSSTQPLAPLLLDHIVQRCLAKEPDERWQTAADVMRELKWVSATWGGTSAVGLLQPPTTRPRIRLRTREGVAWAAVAALLLFSGGMAIRLARPTIVSEAAPVLFSVEPPAEIPLSASGIASSYPTISPNGRHLAFVVRAPDGRNVLAVRRLDNVDTRILPGTEGAVSPFWSPNSQTLAFFAGGQLKRIDIGGGSAQTICSTAENGGGSWNREGIILFAGATGPVFRVSATGGEPSAVTTLDASEQEAFHRTPWFLPDGRRFLYLAQPSNTVFLASLDSPERKSLLRADSKALYSPTGHVLFMRGRTLMAQPFDVDRGEITADVFRIADDVSANATGRATFSVSETGVLAYRTGANLTVTQPSWFDRAGKLLGTFGEEGLYRQVALAPDGSKIAVEKFDGRGSQDIWVIDSRGISTRLTFERGLDPVWSPDSRQVAFGYRRTDGFRVVRRAVEGSEEVLVWQGTAPRYPETWSPDGTLLVYNAYDATTTTGTLPLTSALKPSIWLDTPFTTDEPRFSPDGRWMAYQSNESGQTDVFVQAFPGPGQKLRISTGGGGIPRWRADGRELFYMTQAGMLMAVTIAASTRLEPGIPRPLFQTGLTNPGLTLDQYDVSGDGQRFLVLTPTQGARQTPITVVLNWTRNIVE